MAKAVENASCVLICKNIFKLCLFFEILLHLAGVLPFFSFYNLIQSEFEVINKEANDILSASCYVKDSFYK